VALRWLWGRNPLAINTLWGGFDVALISNRVGQFYAFVKPGNYVVLATLPGEHLPPRNLGGNLPPSSTPGSSVEGMVQITVNTNQLTQVAVLYYPSE
jgi:hypothetical protein